MPPSFSLCINSSSNKNNNNSNNNNYNNSNNNSTLKTQWVSFIVSQNYNKRHLVFCVFPVLGFQELFVSLTRAVAWIFEGRNCLSLFWSNLSD